MPIKMDFTPVNRLILINQFEILEKLNPSESDNYIKYQDILRLGFESDMEGLFENLSEIFSIEKCEFVHEVLNMHSSLLFSYQNIGDTNIDLSQINFLGFDQNHESHHNAYARFILVDEKRYPPVANSADTRLDSSVPMIEAYSRMLQVWRPFFPSKFDRLSEGEIQQILDSKWPEPIV